MNSHSNLTVSVGVFKWLQAIGLIHKVSMFKHSGISLGRTRS